MYKTVRTTAGATSCSAVGRETTQKSRVSTRKTTGVGKNSKGHLKLLSGLLAVSVLFLCSCATYNKSAEKTYQPVLENMFKSRDIGSTAIIGTYCKLIEINSLGENVEVQNIVIGVNNGVLSFFGGGDRYEKKSFYVVQPHTPMSLHTAGKNVAFHCGNVYKNKPSWKHLLKENHDFYLSVWDCYKNVLFPKDESRHFKHLFDIPIENLVEVSGKQIGNNVGIQIESSEPDRLIKLAPYCDNLAAKIDVANTLLGDFFHKIVKNGSISQTKISIIKDKILDCEQEDIEITAAKQRKAAGKLWGTVVSAGMAVGTGMMGAAESAADDQFDY
jgi:hypothetical protein